MKTLLISGAVALLTGLLVWIVFFKPSPQTPQNENTQFGLNDTRTTVGITGGSNNPENTTNGILPGAQSANAVVFKIADGPIVSATFIQATKPTTTLVRFIQQNNGHVFDLAIDSPGSIPKPVSNTTIPGLVRAFWAPDGRLALAQYNDGTVKTLSISLPSPATTTSPTGPVRLQYFPTNITDAALSPDGKSVGYLLSTSAGVDGYTASSNGAGSKKLFSIPLSEILLSWPSTNTLLAETKPAAGVPGMVFSVNTSSGSVVPIVYAPGVSAVADRTFSKVVYQTVTNSSATSLAHDVKSGKDRVLTFSPIPEKCIWSAQSQITMFCGAPLSVVPYNYTDLWHAGVASAGDSVFKFNMTSGTSSVVAIPGSRDGGETSDIAEMALSPDEHYLLFIRKGDRSLWGVRLTK